MQTIVFYSFKGGTGRTSAVAQLTMLLNEFGRRVVAMDLDLGAPGLWERLALPLGFDPNRPVARGMLDYLDSHKARTSLQSLRARAVAAGHVELLGAGDCFARDNQYWKAYFSPDFLVSMAADVTMDQLLVSVKEKIEEEFDGPDFLLIDAPAGVSRLAAIAIELLADDVVLLSANQREGLLGSNWILRSLQDLGATRKIPKRHCVLSRLPRAYTSTDGYRQVSDEQWEDIRNRTLSSLNLGLREGNRVEHLSIFTSEPLLDIQGGEPMRLLPMQNPEYETSALVQDYVRFFPTLISGLDALVARQREPLRQRTFLLAPNLGQMINPADSSPNVALRVDTLVSTFAAIAKVVGEFGGEAATTVMETAGSTAADGFATFLEKKWAIASYESNVPVQPLDRIHEWCEFDSTVGFGKFVSWPAGSLSGKIVLENNFLVVGRPADSEGISLCGLMTGYITRVMAAVFPKHKVTVTHRDEDCARLNPALAGACTFSYLAEKRLAAS
jgi:cellulose biosynthesis protein BcsQ